MEKTTFQELRERSEESETALRDFIDRSDFNLRKIIEDSLEVEKKCNLYSIEEIDEKSRQKPGERTRERLLEKRIVEERKKLLCDNEKIIRAQYPTKRETRPPHIDILAFDKNKKNIIIAELKEVSLDEKSHEGLSKVVIQCLSYWVFVKKNIMKFKSVLKEYKVNYDLDENSDPSIYIIAPEKYFTECIRKNKKNKDYDRACSRLIKKFHTITGVKVKLVSVDRESLEMRNFEP